MADNLKKAPKKGILKNSSSFETVEREKELTKGTKWDEMNIIATYHPKDKDYGHMKIEEPKTPYSYVDQSADLAGLDAELLAEKIQLEGNQLPSAVMQSQEESSEEEEDESPEEKEKKKVFEMKRKQHYNEYAAVKLARKLMEEDEEDGTECQKISEESESEHENENKDCI